MSKRSSHRIVIRGLTAAAALVVVSGCSGRATGVSSAHLGESTAIPSSSAEANAACAFLVSSAYDDFVRPEGVYTLDKPAPDALDVEVSWKRSGGMSAHFADRIRIHSRSGRELDIEVPEDVLEFNRPLAPLLEFEESVDRERVLLPGWSTSGAGLQTYHAMVVTNDGPRIVGELAWTDSRAGVGIAVSGSRIGISQPRSGESELTVGTRHWDRAALDELTYTAPPPGTRFYRAPVKHDEKRSLAARYAWFDLAPPRDEK